MRRVLKRTPEEMARREKIDEMLKAANVTSMADIQDLSRPGVYQRFRERLELLRRAGSGPGRAQ